MSERLDGAGGAPELLRDPAGRVGALLGGGGPRCVGFAAHPAAVALASRILALLGSVAVLSTLASCEEDDRPGATEGDAGGAADAGADGGPEAGPPYQPGAASHCFAWPAGESCPTQLGQIIYEFTRDGCPATGWWVYQVESAPARDASGSCCYDAKIALCPGGGRPYLVSGQPRTAPRAGGTSLEWAAPLQPCLDRLDDGQLARLAEAWTADGLLEHASVASFARFALALMAAGAPASLLAGAQEAALDEVHHARLCFGLAAAYSGRPVAPGPFPIEGAVQVSATLADLAASAVEEGCVGETVAALLASEQLARATDPAVRGVLARLVADEARHAELAWRTVAWALERDAAEVRPAVESAFRRSLCEAHRSPSGPRPEGAALAAHGRLDDEATAVVVDRALALVVAPCARALLGAGARPAQRPSAAARSSRC